MSDTITFTNSTQLLATERMTVLLHVESIAPANEDPKKYARLCGASSSSSGN